MPFEDALLAILPATIAGQTVSSEHDAFDASASDADLARDVASGAVGVAIDPAGADYAIGFVYRLKPGVYDDGWARAWRDSFDTAVCAQAGGVTGHASAQIGSHEVDIGSCGGGVTTYHVHLTDPATGDDLIVSVQALGEQRFGEQMVAGLTA